MKNKADNTNTSNILEAITGRQSVRAFLDKAVPNEVIKQILQAARFAPSGVNTQPWHVAVIGKTHQKKIGDEIIAARNNEIVENPDYQYYPKIWQEPYKSRRKACGMAMYGALNIKIEDTSARQVQWYKNYRFFDAPVGFIFYLDASLCKGSWMDIGMFLQNIMLSARHFNLETCPQAALAEYPDIVRKILAIPDAYHIVCGMAMGYADWNHPVNQYRTERESYENFTRWYT